MAFHNLRRLVVITLFMEKDVVTKKMVICPCYWIHNYFAQTFSSEPIRISSWVPNFLFTRKSEPKIKVILVLFDVFILFTAIFTIHNNHSYHKSQQPYINVFLRKEEIIAIVGKIFMNHIHNNITRTININHRRKYTRQAEKLCLGKRDNDLQCLSYSSSCNCPF